MLLLYHHPIRWYVTLEKLKYSEFEFQSIENHVDYKRTKCNRYPWRFPKYNWLYQLLLHEVRQILPQLLMEGYSVQFQRIDEPKTEMKQEPLLSIKHLSHGKCCDTILAHVTRKFPHKQRFSTRQAVPLLATANYKMKLEKLIKWKKI